MKMPGFTAETTLYRPALLLGEAGGFADPVVIGDPGGFGGGGVTDDASGGQQCATVYCFNGSADICCPVGFRVQTACSARGIPKAKCVRKF